MKKYFAIFTAIFLLISCGRAANRTDVAVTERESVPDTTGCSNVTIIDRQEFEQQYVQADTIMPSAAFNKKGLTVTIPETDIVFKDDTTATGYQEFFALGMLKDFYVVEQLDYHNAAYYLVNKNTNEMYNLIGLPKVYGKTILSVEGESVDNPVDFELWLIDRKVLKLQKKFTLNQCGIYTITDAYLSRGYLYVKHMPLSDKYEYHKIKL